MPWRYAEPPYTSMPSYRMTDIRFAIGGIGAGAGRQRRRPLHRSISRHSGHPVTSPSTTPPPSAATRPECAAQPSYAVVTNRAIPPIRNNQPRNCATTPGVSRQIRPDAHHGSTQDPWPKHPSTTPAGLRPTTPASAHQAAIMSIVSPPSGRSPIQGQRNGTFAGRSTCRHRPQVGKRGVISTIALSKLTGPNSLKMACICEF